MRSAALVLLFACGQSSAPHTPPIKFLTTFDRNETELFNKTIADRGLVVDAALVPFARGQQVITAILTHGTECPDLIRIDATWLPALAAQHLLQPPPPELARMAWSPIASELAAIDGTPWAVPQSIDGLVVVRAAGTPAPASDRIADLVAVAKTSQLPHPLGVRVDGYWLVPWLRDEGVELAPAAIATEAGEASAVRAFASFAGLFGPEKPAAHGVPLAEDRNRNSSLAAQPPSAGSEAPDELRRWTAHELAYWVTGPWQFGALRDRDQIEISRIAHAPRGGQLLVVPACAAQPLAGWKLATELTSEPVALIFSDAFATIPTLASAQEHATSLVKATLAALTTAEPLPRTQVTPLLFDDLNPALVAVIAGDATPAEAVAGLRRGWQREAKP